MANNEELARMTDAQLCAHFGVGVDEARMIAALHLGEGGDAIALDRTPPRRKRPAARRPRNGKRTQD